MKKIYINELKNYYDKEIEVSGFVDNIRDLQWVQFVILKDSTGKVQITIEKSDEKNKDMVELISNLTLESTVKVKCIVKENPKVKLNGMELIPSNICVTSTAFKELPIDIKNKDNTLRETRLDYRYLDLRREDNLLLFECQSYIEQMMREYWYNNGYKEIHTPKISRQAAESGAETFKLDYFGEKACLSQSPQFYKQMTMASNFDKVFEIGPVFRAENSHTSYHATEILMLDCEISWINSVDDVMDEEEAWIKYFMRKLKEKYGPKLADKIINILLTIAILSEQKFNPEKMEVYIKDKDRIDLELKNMQDKQKYTETITKEKLQLTKKIKDIDKILNNKELLKNEYIKRNENVTLENKIFSMRVLSNIMVREREELYQRIQNLNYNLNPKNFVKHKKDLEEQYQYLELLDVEDLEQEIRK